MAPRYVVVSGPPGSGKTTLAAALAAELRLPLLSKDVVKETLASELGAQDLDTSRRLGGASIAVVIALAAESPVGAVVESVFSRTRAGAELASLPGEVIEVFCRCDRAVALARYRARARDAAHFDDDRSPDDLWNAENAEPVAGGWPVVEVTTNGAVDVAALVARLRALMR